MFISEDTLDDALLQAYRGLLNLTGETVVASRGENAEVIGAFIDIKNPRARLSRSETRGKLFSSLGELLWYLSKDNRLDFIAPYVPRYRDETEDGVTVYGGYGPRLFGPGGADQVGNVIKLLGERPSSRRAVIQIFNGCDIATEHREIPCTTTLQFFVRNERVEMVVTMRSNDAYFGLPHDVFCFSMLQEIVARTLNRDVGAYRHFAGSLHLYKERWGDAQHFVNEGYQQQIAMPEMPPGDPWESIAIVLAAEARARGGETFNAGLLGLDNYWADLVRIVQIFFAKGDQSRIACLADQITFKRYRPYILSRL
ncbi:thymidylate synthase [Bradyrhizobium japonicum]|uniref:thymidylate synthase n=1 Tax=Bradyrhizobium japonicum TaxID=375 RepID=A0ABV2RXK1_BRAJP|nr:thymidylate synthase [Bradyrhizobium japonicum]UQD95237.1 thymidylate synthase [Bradyrhizobium japonicum]